MKRLQAVSIVVSGAALFAVVLAHGQTQADNKAQPNTTVRGGPFPRQLTVYDRAGRVLRTMGEPTVYRGQGPPVLAPDGTRLAVVMTDPTRPRVTNDVDPGRNSMVRDILVFNLSTGSRTHVTSGPEVSWPVWSPDGRQIAYSASRQGHGGLYRKASNGTGSEELLYQHTELGVNSLRLTDWSPDGRFLTFGIDGVLWVLRLGTQRAAVELLREEYEANTGRLSPDSRFLAYRSDESGADEVYVRAFDPSTMAFSLAGAKWRVSDLVDPGSENTSRGGAIEWRRDGRELYYQTADGGVMAVDVASAPTFKAGPRKLLFQGPKATPGSISRDGQRVAFDVAKPPERRVITVAPEILAQYTGTYVGPEESYSVVTLEGNQLMIQRTGRAKFPLFAESENSFFFRRASEGDTDVQFVKDDQGAVTQFLAYTGGPGRRFPRK